MQQTCHVTVEHIYPLDANPIIWYPNQYSPLVGGDLAMQGFAVHPVHSSVYDKSYLYCIKHTFIITHFCVLLMLLGYIPYIHWKFIFLHLQNTRDLAL